MNTFKAEVNKIFLALTSVGIVILLMFPVSLSASHFRYGTMSWVLTGNDNATHTEIRLYVETGWRTNVGNPFDTVGETATTDPATLSNFININWGDGFTTSGVVIRTTSIDTAAGSSNAEIGTLTGDVWTPGLTHSYSDNGTYIVYWGSQARIAGIVNIGDSSKWRNETKVTIGGIHAGNVSPVSTMPPIVQVQDNTTDNFTFQVSATDANSGDNLHYRWGTWQEFVDNETSTYYPPTGMSLSSTGYIQWDVRDSALGDNAPVNSSAVANSGKADALWLAFIMVEDNGSSGDNKSYIPLDFFFKIASASNDPASLSGIPNELQTVSIGTTKNITITSTDDSGVAPIITVLNPPSDNSSIWSTDNTTSGGETTFTISFTPDSSMAGNTYVINIRSTDNASMTKDQSFSIQVSSVSNADPTAPTLISPANGDNVTAPVSFRFAASTDSDGDNVSYTMYICGNSGFVGCSGTSVTAGGNFVPPFNQNFHDNLIPWPSLLYAATSSQQISQDLSMIPKLFIMLGVLGLLSVIISLSVKNITHRRILYVLFLIIIGTVSCSTSSSNDDEIGEGSTDNTTSTDTTAPTVTSVSTTADNQSSVSITDNITVTFSEAMDSTYITTSTSDTNCAGTIRVSPDNFSSCVRMSSEPVSSNSNKTFTLDPYDNLTRLTTYLTRVTTGVKDTAGNAMSSQYEETSSGFTTDNSSITFSNSGPTSGGTYSNGTTYYWKVVASDPKGGSAQSETWSFTVQE